MTDGAAKNYSASWKMKASSSPLRIGAKDGAIWVPALNAIEALVLDRKLRMTAILF